MKFAIVAAALACFVPNVWGETKPGNYPAAVLNENTLIGASGELFKARDDGFYRSEAGGISTEVVAAFQAPGGVIYAIGEETPIFARRNGVWSVEPLPNRGPVSLSTTGSPTIAIGRHVYRLGPTGLWGRISSAKTQILSLTTNKRGDVWVATKSGQVSKMRKKRVRAVMLRTDDPVTFLFSHAAKVFGATESGEVLLLSTKLPRTVSKSPELAGYVPTAITRAGNKTLFVFSTPDGTERKFATLANRSVSVVGKLPTSAPLTLFRGFENGKVLLASEDGTTWGWGGAASTWLPVEVRFPELESKPSSPSDLPARIP